MSGLSQFDYYTTYYKGDLIIDRPLDIKTYKLAKEFADPTSADVRHFKISECRSKVCFTNGFFDTADNDYEFLILFINMIIIPNGFKINGKIKFCSHHYDSGEITVEDNIVTIFKDT